MRLITVSSLPTSTRTVFLHHVVVFPTSRFLVDLQLIDELPSVLLESKYSLRALLFSLSVPAKARVRFRTAVGLGGSSSSWGEPGDQALFTGKILATQTNAGDRRKRMLFR